ncbi:hypothetical protein RCOM_0911760 [Ricinus communis]|uniref:N-acetyltransferase domain-containing protein n=1 Tax=Ricinus communis TaxID=3988 RepID=B9RTP1_RICCO|nr:hypothetical protein RCOM_0911760 [Ricinus communis]
MVVKTIFDDMPELERLEALVDVENLGSERVLEKAGFMREGVLRKYCILHGQSRDLQKEMRKGEKRRRRPSSKRATANAMLAMLFER